METPRLNSEMYITSTLIAPRTHAMRVCLRTYKSTQNKDITAIATTNGKKRLNDPMLIRYQIEIVALGITHKIQ